MFNFQIKSIVRVDRARNWLVQCVDKNRKGGFGFLVVLFLERQLM